MKNLFLLLLCIVVLFSVVASALVIVFYRKQKSGVKMKMYGMIQSKLGVKFK